MDELTGLPSLKELPPAVEQMFAASSGQPMATIFFDIDRFRYVICEHGHLVGDEVLRKLGAWFAEEANAVDGHVFRVAGDELLLFLPGRTLDEATAIARRVVSTPRDLITLSAVVFFANATLPQRLRETLETLAKTLYRAELASGQEHGNVVVEG